MLPFTIPLMTDVREFLSTRPWCLSDLLAVGLRRAIFFRIKVAAKWQFESHKQSEVSGLLKEGLEQF